MVDKKFLLASLVSLNLITCGRSFANENLRRVGDIIQYASPIACIMLDTNPEKFLLHYGATMAVVGIGKWTGKKLHYGLAQRPDKTAYTGMPSGHTASAWTAASYARYSARSGNRNHDLARYVLYPAAAICGYSRVAAKRHTILQVATSIVLSELIGEINYRWLQGRVRLGFYPDPLTFQLVIK